MSLSDEIYSLEYLFSMSKKVLSFMPEIIRFIFANPLGRSFKWPEISPISEIVRNYFTFAMYLL